MTTQVHRYDIIVGGTLLLKGLKYKYIILSIYQNASSLALTGFNNSNEEIVT